MARAPISLQGFMLKLWISGRQDELLAGTAPLDTFILLFEVVLAFMAASAALKVPGMCAMRWTFPPVHFTVLVESKSFGRQFLLG